jgi:hypothetical protein
MDYFYTRHTLGLSLKKITDGEAHLCGTVWFTNVNATNRYYLKTAIKELKDKPRGSWFLVRAYNKTPNYNQLQQAHAAQQCRLPKQQRTPFIPPIEVVAENSGYIVLKDSKIVTFCTNDLATTPSQPILDATNEEAVVAVCGL